MGGGGVWSVEGWTDISVSGHLNWPSLGIGLRRLVRRE